MKKRGKCKAGVLSSIIVIKPQIYIPVWTQLSALPYFPGDLTLGLFQNSAVISDALDVGI